MIIQKITSGLGNQMFQYAFYTLIREKYRDTKILCDTTWFNAYDEHHGYELERIFKNVPGSEFNIEKASVPDITRLSGMIPTIVKGKGAKLFDGVRRIPNRILKDTLLRKRKPFILNQTDGDIEDDFITDENGNTINPFFDKVMNLDTSSDYFIIGFFIEERYYLPILPKIKKHFVFDEITEEQNIKYAGEIEETDSVSIHIRRGDYLSDLYKDKFIALNREYYENAVKLICEKITARAQADGRKADIRFFVFSDDKDFVESEFGWLENKTIVCSNTGDKSYRDMQLMSMCKHNIIANSTFSQWGALLNNNEGHITIYPKSYMNGKDSEVKTSPGWIRI